MTTITEKQKFFRLARVARGHCEAVVRAEKPQRYSPEKLAGLCGTASFHLFRLASRFKIKPTFVDGRVHCWIEYKGRVFDITATQFGKHDYPPVFHIPLPDKKYFPFYNEQSGRGKFRTQKQLKEIFWKDYLIYKDHFDELIDSYLKGTKYEIISF